MPFEDVLIGSQLRWPCLELQGPVAPILGTCDKFLLNLRLMNPNALNVVALRAVSNTSFCSASKSL